MRTAVIVAAMVFLCLPVLQAGATDTGDPVIKVTLPRTLSIDVTPVQTILPEAAHTDFVSSGAELPGEGSIAQVSQSVREKLIAIKKICWLPYKQALYAAVSRSPRQCGSAGAVTASGSIRG